MRRTKQKDNVDFFQANYRCIFLLELRSVAHVMHEIQQKIYRVHSAAFVRFKSAKKHHLHYIIPVDKHVSLNGYILRAENAVMTPRTVAL